MVRSKIKSIDYFASTNSQSNCIVGQIYIEVAPFAWGMYT